MPTNFSSATKSLVSRRYLQLLVGLAVGSELVGCSGTSSNGDLSNESEAAARKQIESAENAEMQRHEAAPPTETTKPQ